MVDSFTGEDIGGSPSDVEPQHLAPNDAMLYDLDLLDCSPDASSSELAFLFTAEWEHPVTGATMVDTVSMTVAEMLAADHGALDKASAIVDFALAFEQVSDLPNAWERGDHLDGVLATLGAAQSAVPGDEDLAAFVDQATSWRAMYP